MWGKKWLKQQYCESSTTFFLKTKSTQINQITNRRVFFLGKVWWIVKLSQYCALQSNALWFLSFRWDFSRHVALLWCRQRPGWMKTQEGIHMAKECRTLFPDSWSPLNVLDHKLNICILIMLGTRILTFPAHFYEWFCSICFSMRTELQGRREPHPKSARVTRNS